jgi:hypothetical protein
MGFEELIQFVICGELSGVSIIEMGGSSYVGGGCCCGKNWDAARMFWCDRRSSDVG